MQRPHFDTLIIGQGLAGSALAWQLITAGQRVCVIDDGHRSSSSIVAAGLINPLAGMRFNRRPEMDDWLAAAERWYQTLSATFDKPFFHGMPMLRLFRSAQQRRFYDRRVADPASRDLLGDAFAAHDCPEAVGAIHGGFVQKHTGFVDLPLLLGTLRDWLAAQHALRNEQAGIEAIELGRNDVRLGGVSATRLVFCDGARLRGNPWFGNLPLAPEKGEILNVVVDGWRPRHIVNGAHWLVPLANGEIRLGATHDHQHLDNTPTSAGREQLLAGLAALHPHDMPTRVLRHQAGVRPGTTDRYALLGQHPAHAPLWVFNGFGARGALTIPWYAERMAAHLLHDTALPAEVDIRRFA